ncbi:MAG: cyclic pyranopterin monophosphate synthase MoaC [Dehalococcoidia bacterium]|nr:cyclic pyranopterin monophosphate synthase MoaC [Dehalococcoidia bacterium]
MSDLTHLDPSGRAKMVDVSQKPDTEREAIARGRVVMAPETFRLVKEGRSAKGDVLAVAQVAGIMAAKQTPQLIPMCHPLNLTSVSIHFDLMEVEHAVDISAAVRTLGKTGVEMEALTAVAVCALTIYDMCKAVDRGMRIESIRLARKSGGKSGVMELE